MTDSGIVLEVFLYDKLDIFFLSGIFKEDIFLFFNSIFSGFNSCLGCFMHHIIKYLVFNVMPMKYIQLYYSIKQLWK